MRRAKKRPGDHALCTGGMGSGRQRENNNNVQSSNSLSCALGPLRSLRTVGAARSSGTVLSTAPGLVVDRVNPLRGAKARRASANGYSREGGFVRFNNKKLRESESR